MEAGRPVIQAKGDCVLTQMEAVWMDFEGVLAQRQWDCGLDVGLKKRENSE